MRNHRGKGLHVLSFIACILLFANCTKKDVYDPYRGKTGVTDLFDFATTANTELKINYGIKGYKAMFEVYTENPISIVDDEVVKKENIDAVFKAYTDNNCEYSGVINLPTASSKIYIYTDAFGLPQCLEADVTSTGINLNLDEYISQQSLGRSISRAEESYTFNEPFDKTKNPYNVKAIGTWDKIGKPNYLEANAIIPEGLMNRIQKTLISGKDNTSYTQTTEVTNIRLLKSAQISLIFASEWATWRNSLGYYYYPTGKKLTKEEFEALPKYIALPNCSVYGCPASDVTNTPLQPSNQLKLRYYGEDYNANPSLDFPQGVTIGWFLLPAGFDLPSNGKGPQIYPNGRWNHPVIFSNMEFNVNKASSCVSIYDEKSSKLIIGFEDGADKSYNDVLFYVEATPNDAIFDEDRPTTKPEEYDPTTTTKKGTLAFEDLWPHRGDYDLNDVVIRYNSATTKNAENKIIKIVDTFTPQNAGGSLLSGFGYQLGISSSKIKSVEIVNGSSIAEVTNNMETKQEKATIMLFDDIHKTVGKTITVTIILDGTETEKTILFPPYNPFIYPRRPTEEFQPGEPRKEIHLPNFGSTSLVNTQFFGNFDDYTYLDKSGKYVNYYMTVQAYPFAIDIPITNYNHSKEGIAIDISYPKFKTWAESKGKENQNWYLYPEN